MINVRCCGLKCGVVFGLPDHVFEQAQGDPKRMFFCPNGHEQHYSRDKLAEATKNLELERQRTQRLEDEVTRRERTISYWKGIVSRLRRRR